MTKNQSASDIHFRDAVAADRDAVTALWAACGLTRPWNDAASDFDRALSGPSSTVLVGICADAVIASAMVGDDGHRGTVYYVSITPKQQGTDLGRRLMAAAEDWLRARGAGKINLLVRNENARATGFYEALGYDVEPNTQLGKWLTPH